MGYGIGLSGLKSASEAIDVTSNNISNSRRRWAIKSGEYVFSDQFFRAQDPQSMDQCWYGLHIRMAIRRTGSYGTVVEFPKSIGYGNYWPRHVHASQDG